MTSLRLLRIAFTVAAILVGSLGHAASTTDYSDQWWVTSESGWGVTVQQQGNVLVIHPLVYASDGKPGWFTAIAFQQANAPAGHTLFTGNLYAPTGPYYGGAFDPARVTWRKVGALTFDATAPNAATITYTVDGVPVVKNVTRETWVDEHLGGSYYAIWKYGCGGGSTNRQEWGATDTTIVHGADNAVTMRVSNFFFLPEVTLGGRYAQSGHMGTITANLAPPNTGAVTISEIEKSSAGFSARLSGNLGSCQITNGRVVAVRLP